MNKVYIFGYLSLILKESAGTSIDESDFHLSSVPAKLYGYSRTWGSIRSNEDEDFKRYVIFPEAKLVENFCWATIVSSHKNNFVNGVCIEVDECELTHLDIRETGYTRCDVTEQVHAYEGFSLESYKIYTYIAPNSSHTAIDQVYIDSDYMNLGLRGAHNMDRIVPGFLNDYLSSTSTPDALVRPLRQVFWGDDGRNLYLLAPDSTVVLIHQFMNYRFSKLNLMSEDSHYTQKITEELSCFDLRSGCSDCNDLYYTALTCSEVESINVLSKLNNFMINIQLLRNKKVPEKIKLKIVSQGDWITQLVAQDLGYNQVNFTDSWSKRLCAI